MSTDNQANNKRIFKNTIYLYIRMFVLMGVTLYTSRVVLGVLGVDKYGVWNLISGVVVLFSFVQNSLATAIQRYISFNLGRNDFNKNLDILYNSKTILLYFSLIFIIVCETGGIFFIDNYLNIPNELIVSSRDLFQIVIINSIILLFRIPYDAWIIAHEKMSFYSLTSLVEGGLNLLAVLLLCKLPGESLINYGIIILSVSLIMFLWYAFYCKFNWHTKVLRLKHDGPVFKELFSFSGFTMLGSVSSILSTQGLNFLLNNFFYVAVNASMGIAQQVNGAVNKFITNFQTAFKPQLVKLYSSNNHIELEKLIYLASRVSFFMMWIIVCPLLVNIQYVLELWLGEVPLYSSGLCALMLVCSLIECISSPLWMTIQATGNIKSYQITISLTNISVLFVSFVLLYFWLNVNAVLVSKLIVDIIVLSERLYFSNKLFNLSIRKFLTTTISRFVVVPIPSFILCYFFHCFLFSNYSIISLSFDILFSLSLNFTLIYYIGLNSMERTNIKNNILKKFKYE